MSLLALAALVAYSGWLALRYVPTQKQAALDRWRSQLSATADDRKMALDVWLGDGMGDAATIALYPTLRHELSAPVPADARPSGVGDRRHLEQLLGEAVASQDYRSATAFDAAGRILARVPAGVEVDAESSVARAAIAEVGPVAEVSSRPSGQRASVFFAAPVPGEAPGAGPRGAVVLEVDAARFLLPFIGPDSEISESAETMLARRDIDEAVFVGPLRYDERPAPRRPLDAPAFAMAAALAGDEGFTRAIDYRGVPVLAATRRLESRPWGLVVKVDEAEALAPVRRLLGWQLAAALAALATVGVVAAAFLHGQRTRHAMEMTRARARMVDLLETTRDVILFVGPDGRIREANERAVRFYGWPREGLLGRHVFALRAPGAAATASADFERAKRDGAVFEAVHVRADGSQVPVEVSSGTVDPRDGTIVSIVRDASERKAREARIVTLSRLYRTLSKANQTLVRAGTEGEVLDGVCRALAEEGGFPLAWVGLRRPGGRVEVAARAGRAAAYADGLDLRSDDTPEGRGPTGRAIRESRPVVVPDFADEPAFAPWRERAARHGLRCSAAFPVPIEGETQGALMIYADSPGAIGDEERALLGELAGDVGYALGAFRTRERLRALFEGDVIGILFGTADGRILEANDTLLRIVGYDRADVREGRLRWDAITPPDWLPADARGIAEARARGSCTPYEKEYVRSDGTRVPVLVGYVLLEPERERSVAFILDLTERKQAEASARAAEARFRAFMEHLPGLAGLKDRDGRFVYVNPALAGMMDGTGALIEGHRLEELSVHPAAARALAIEDEVRRSGRARLDAIDAPAGARPRSFLVSTFPVPVGGEAFLGFITLDVTEQRRAEVALRESEERLRLFVEHAPASLAMFDREMRYLQVSRRWLTDYGLSGRELRGLSHYEVFPEITESWREVHRRGLAGEVVTCEADRFERADGSVQWLRWEVRPWRNAEGEVGGIVIFSEDSTERERVAAELRRERDFSNAVLDGLPGILYCYDEGHRFVRWNRNFETVSGRSPDEVARLSPLDYFEGAERELVAARIRETFERGSAEVEADFLAADGTRTPYFFTGLRTEIGGRIHLVGVGIDVSARRRAEAALRESEARYRGLLDVAPVGIAVHSEGRIVFANPAGARLLGASDGRELVGRAVADVVHPDGWEVSRERIGRMLAGEQGLYPAEDVYVRLDGAPFDVEVTATALPYEGRPAVQEIVADITERKRGERRTRLLNERLRALARAVQDLSRARDEAAVVEVVRLSARGLVGADGITFVAREDGECHYVDEDAMAPLWKGRRFPITSCISGWVMLHGEVAVVEDIESDPRIPIGAYRGTFVESLAMAPVGRAEPIAAIGAYWRERRRPDEEEVHLLQALADATAQAFENVRLYAELERRVAERTEQLEAANRELEGFSYSVSHDLRAPLRAIDGFARILAEDHAAALDAEGLRVLGVVRDGVRRMAQLVDDLLEFSRAGRRELRRGTVDMGEVLRAAFDEVARGGIEGVELQAGRLEPALGDAALLKQVWANLLSNALKFTRSKPRRRIDVECRRDEGRLVYSVRDNGVGFDERYKGKLFGVFQRLHSGGEFEGTGVGLALVERIVSRHGGGVFAEGRLGEGATFGFWLPDEGGGG